MDRWCATMGGMAFEDVMAGKGYTQAGRPGKSRWIEQEGFKDMSRFSLWLIILAVIVIVVLVGLSFVNTQVPPQPVEKPVANEMLAN